MEGGWFGCRGTEAGGCDSLPPPPLPGVGSSTRRACACLRLTIHVDLPLAVTIRTGH